MEIETRRLLLKTQDLSFLGSISERDFNKIESLGYKISEEWPGEDYYDAIPYFKNLLSNDEYIEGFGPWMIIEKEKNEIIGGIGYLNVPDENGEVEIGFGINESKRRKGYCYEAATNIIGWAGNNDSVKYISAVCEKDNNASKCILMKLGFKIYTVDELIKWKLNTEFFI